MDTQSAPWLSYVIPAVVIAIVLSLRLRRMNQARPLKLETLWVVPAIYLAVAVAIVWSTPPAGAGAWAVIALALLAGAGAGWQRGRSMRIAIDPETHRLNHRASPLTMLILVALVLFRGGIRSLAVTEGAAWHLDAALVTDGFVALALGLFAATRAEMYLRGRRLLDAARA